MRAQWQAGVMSWCAQLCQKGAGKLSHGSPGDGVVPGLPSVTGTLKGSWLFVMKRTHWRCAKPCTAYGAGRDGSLAASLSASGTPNKQEPGSKQVKRSNFLPQWTADVWHPLQKGAVDSGGCRASWRGLKKSCAEQTQKTPDFGVAGGWESAWRSIRGRSSVCFSLGVCLRPPFLFLI